MVQRPRVQGTSLPPGLRLILILPQLVFHAGRLSHLQRSFTDSASALAASFPPSSAFYSPVLQNRLSQIAASPAFPMDSAAFLQPLYARRQQLRWPTARLQSTAQRVLLGMGGSAAGGAGVAWAGWAGQLGILDFAMQGETVVGLGMLGAVLGVRWTIGRFERAKTKWLRDYDRVGEGLERDLRVSMVAWPRRCLLGLIGGSGNSRADGGRARACCFGCSL